MANADASTLGRTGNVIALGLLLLFGVAVVWTLAWTLKPPLLADERPPRPLCVVDSSQDVSDPADSEQSESPTEGSRSPGRSGGNSAGSRSDGDNGAPRSTARSNRSSGNPQPSKPRTVSCPGGELQYPMQARGAYDPNERFIGLLAVVGPLITTVVGFFFGARAGSTEGRAQAAQARARTESLEAAAALGTPDIVAEAKRIAPQAWEK